MNYVVCLNVLDALMFICFPAGPIAETIMSLLVNLHQGIVLSQHHGGSCSHIYGYFFSSGFIDPNHI